jgi:hypothetical protein
VGRQKSRDRPFADPLRLGHQSSCECHGAHNDDEELDGQGEAAIWLDLVNGHKQYGGDDADAEDVNESQHSDFQGYDQVGERLALRRYARPLR